METAKNLQMSLALVQILAGGVNGLKHHYPFHHLLFGEVVHVGETPKTFKKYICLLIFVNLFGYVRSLLHHAGSFIAGHGLQLCAGSIVAMLRPCCSTACGISVPWPACRISGPWPHVPCIARQILNNWITREVPSLQTFTPMFKWVGGFPHSPVVKTLHSQFGGPGFNSWLGNWIPHVATRDPACGNEDRRSHVLQLRSGTAEINKLINKQTNKITPTNQPTKKT